MPTNFRRALLPLLGFGCLLTASTAQAQCPPGQAPTGPAGIKINSAFEFRFDVKIGPQANTPRAPWYTYFPADPNLMAAARGSQYPPWPNQYPPAINVPAPLTPTPAMPTNRVTWQTPTWGWPQASLPGTAVQPVGFVPAQVPSYWYGR